MIELSAHLIMRYTVFLVVLVSVALSINSRKKLAGAQRDLFDRCLAGMAMFTLAIIFHVIREDIWATDLLRIPESLLFLLGFIWAFSTSMHAVNHKEEWGLQGI